MLLAAEMSADLKQLFGTLPFPFPFPSLPSRPGRKGVDTGETRALGLLCQFPLLAISAYTHVTCCRNLSRFEATFFWPTNKDSIHKKHFKPIGLLMWVKKL